VIILQTHIVQEISEKERFVDFIIGVFPGFETRNAVKKGIKQQRFLLNGEVSGTGNWVVEGDRIDLLERTVKPKAYDKEIEIIYEDDDLAIVNKPAGLVVSGNQFKTLENCLVDQLIKSSREDALEWSLPVHRLDAPTSGLVLFAKTISTRRKLGEMLQNGAISKEYHAIVHGIPGEGIIDLKIDGKEAVSRLKVVRSVPSLQNEALTLVQLEPVTGRTHQLRIHCQSIGNAIVGDQKHGNSAGTFKNKGLFLAATRLQFTHPVSMEEIQVEIPLPHKFSSLLNREEKRVQRYQ